MDRGKLVTFVLLAIALILFIVGIIMLAVGVHKSHKNKDCPNNPPAPVCTTTKPTDYSQLAAVFASTRHQDIAWTDDLNKPDSNDFKTAQTAVVNAINKALVPNSFAEVLLTSRVPVKIIVHKFMQDVIGGAVKVDAYSSLIYTEAVDDTTLTSINSALNVTFGGAYCKGSPIDYCRGDPVPPPYSNPVATTMGPTTPPQPGSTTTMANGAWCDASKNTIAVVFLIDLAMPQFGNYSDKLATIRTYLSTVDQYVNLPQTGNWSNVWFFLVPYYGYDAYTLGSAPVTDHRGWVNAVNLLNESLNYNQNDAHNLPHALNYVQETLGKQIPAGIARTIITVTDGFDQRSTQSGVDTAQQLKSEYYSISVISSAQSSVAQNALETISSDTSRYYPIDDLTWLKNRGTLAATSYWICNAYYPTDPPSTMSPSRVPLEISTTPQLTTVPKTTAPPTTTPPANCAIDVIFLLDESQTMLDTWFDKAQTFVANTADQLLKLQSDTQFGLVSFNQKLVYSSYSSQGFFDINGLKSALSNITRDTGVVDFKIGFTEVRQILKDYGRNNTAVLPLIVFLTDGDQLGGNVDDVIPITTDLRNAYGAEIIGLGLNPLPALESLIKRALGVGAGDTYTAAKYLRVNNTNQLLSTTITDTLMSIDCKRQPGPPDTNCYTDITFVFESSYATTLYQQTEIEAIKATISHFASSIGSFMGRLSVLYFSSPDATSTLVQLSADAQDVIKQLSTATIPNGGASDLAGVLTLVNTVLDNNHLGNNQVVVLFARGLYTDGSSINCCNDPQPAADQLKKRATVQAVMMGLVTNVTLLTSLSNTKVIDANSLITVGNDSWAVANGQKVAGVLNPILDNLLASAPCQAIPDFPPNCPEFIDITLAFHASPTNMPMVKNFITQMLLPSLFGGSLSTARLSQQSPINLAVMTIDSSDNPIYSDFTQQLSPSEYANLIQGVNSTTSTAPFISKAYSWTNDQRSKQLTRSWASTIVIVITDATTPLDNPSGELGALYPAYAEGIQIGSLSPQLIVSTQPIVVSDINQINPSYLRSSKGLANVLSSGACRVVTTPAPPPTTTTTTTTTPVPAPRPKPRLVWPDITILVDTSYDGQSAMTDQGFQLIRQFIYTYFLDQLFIGDQGSRVSLATFDETVNIACLYSDIHSYYDLYDCIVNKFEYSLWKPRTKTRDVANALNTLQSTVFNLTNGYIPQKENFLVIFTTGSSSSTSDTTAALQSIQRYGIRTLGIDLGGSMDLKELSLYGIDSYPIPQWIDENTGIMGNNLFGYQIVDFFTNEHRQPLSNFYADFYLILDMSYALNGFFDQMKTFVHNFGNLLTLGDNKARLWVVPYNDGVIQSAVLANAIDSQQFESWYSNNFTYNRPNFATANIGPAIDQVVTYMDATLSSNKVAHVIYVVQAPYANGTEKAYQLQNNKNIYQYVLQTNPQVNYSSVLQQGSVFACNQTDDLNNWIYSDSNNITAFFNTMIDVQELYRQNATMTLAEVQIDVAIALDQTGLTNSTFESLKSYLVSLVSRFHISKTGAQFALQGFSGRQEVEGGFHFIDSNDTQSLINNIRAIKYRAANPDTTESDLVTALSQINRNFLVPQKGWRNGPTYVLMLPSGQHFYNTTQAIADALKITQRARTFALGLNGNRYDFVRQFVTGKDDSMYQIVSDPTALVQDSDADKYLSQDITKWFEALVYPSLPSLSDVNADFIFLIDHFTTLGKDGFAAVQKYLIDFITNQVPNVGTASRMAVVSYGYATVIPAQGFDLLSFHSQQELIDAVNSLQYYETWVDPDLNQAINYFFHNSSFGYRSDRLTIVVDIASSPTIYQPINPQTTYALNQETFTFAYTYTTNNGTRWDYLSTFLGADGADNYQPQYGFNTVDKAFKDYVINSYAAWYATYG